ncbi:glycine betaine ABC transporter substrate-binding protein [Zobellella maritima]|uniref:glycine betaine ABC transporter substrate-binding protein n=1 Tax=Zobellella maritima TaxID=2059725 RepID=UPI000E3078B3|nr:glycine betaine ABC transporter substrate-binding protein [Zobellella maritima]
MKKLSLLLLSLLLTGCGKEEQKHIHLLSGDWDLALASSHMAKAALEQAGYSVSMELANPGQIWSRLAAGEADASLSLWMPQSSAAYVERFFDRLHDLGPNYPALKLGMAVPEDAPVDSLEQLAGSGYGAGLIVGIDASHGIMRMAEQALALYGLNDYRLQPGSVEAYRQQGVAAMAPGQEGLFIAWQPDRLLSNGKLRLLADSKAAFAIGERPHTLVRRGLEDSAPRAMEILAGLDWQPQDMVWMFEQVAGGKDFAQAAERWLPRTKGQEAVAGPL